MLHMHKSMHVINHSNRMKDKNNMIIALDEEKTFDRVQNPFRLTTFNKLSIEKTYLSTINAIYENPRPL